MTPQKLERIDIAYPYIHPLGSISYAKANNKYMVLAKNIAKKESLDTTMPNATVLVNNGVVIGSGANGSKYHDKHGCERIRLNIPTGQSYELCEGCHPKNHSEPTAITAALKARNDTKGAEAYLWGHWWCCESCWNDLIKNGINKVYFLEGSEYLFDKGSSKNIVGRQFA